MFRRRPAWRSFARLCLLSLFALCLIGCGQSSKQGLTKPTPPRVDCERVQLPSLPDSPIDSRQASEWVIVAAGVFQETATAYHSLADCIEAHRGKGIIR